MRRLMIPLALAVVATPFFAAANDASGIWQSGSDDDGNFLHVEIAPCAGDAARLCGTIIDAQNPDPAKADASRRAELLGVVMLKDMAPDGASAWADGTVWAPDDEKTYSGKMRLKDGILTVSGCVLGGLICRGQDWTRVK